MITLTALGALGWSMRGSTPPAGPRSIDEDRGANAGEWAEAQLQTMTLEQKVAQLFSSYAYGRFKSADDPTYERLIDLVEHFEVGGIIFFQGDPLSQALLANDLQQRSRLPLLVSQDMEWGAGMRLERTTTFPRTMALGATRNPALAYAAGRVTAEEARALGTHQIYAPVADVNNNPLNPIINVRSFGERPDLVAEMVAAFVRGAQDGGVLATAKHFPGHGDTSVDSHSDLPILPFDRPRLDSLELVPFRAAVEAGVQSVMTGHLALPAFDADKNIPASLSPGITRAILRDELAFDGLIVTDALRMQGVTKHFGVGEAAIRALEAGADMLLLTDDEYAARNAILRALDSGRLTVERVDESVMRILRAKEELRLHENRLVDLAGARRHVSTKAHQALSETIARRSLTLLNNEKDLLPLIGPPKSILSITLSDSDNPSAGRYFTGQLRRHADGSRITPRLLDRRSEPKDYRQVLAEASTYDVILVPTFIFVRSGSGRIGLSQAHRRFLDDLAATGKPVVLISFGNPYMVVGLARRPSAYIAAYGGTEASQTAAAQALFGQSGFEGELPISIPGLYDFGAGLRLDQVAPRLGLPEETGMDSPTLARIDSMMRASIQARAFPGAAVAIGRANVIVKLDGYGYFTYDSEQRVTPDSRFDLASLTKVVSTTTAAMQLFEQGRLDLEAPVIRYLPRFGQNGKEAVTIRHLLTHTSGLPPFRPFYRMGVTTREAVIDSIFAIGLEFEPGVQARYSDFSMITLALVIEQITGQEFSAYAQEHIFEPLGMRNTGFRPAGATDTTFVPTEVDDYFRLRLIQGEVHDETAWLLGGTAGHAGLFSTAADLARFASMLVNGGRINGYPFLKEETIRLFTTPVDPEHHTRALGWDTRSLEGYSSAGRYFGPKSFGHTGFTGTSLWIDPDQHLFAILLTNRVYPTRDNRGHVAVRPQLADLAYEAIRGEPTLLLPAGAR
ncbi:MAG: glycoside hydrolase family 3 N-terminal domain-containing protein [Rhodothermales bacterium]